MYCDFPVFGRCCICLPLRQGILLFGYLNLILSLLLVSLYSYIVHISDIGPSYLVFHGAVVPLVEEISIFIYLVEAIASCVLVYGVHVKNSIAVKSFYYYAITTTVACIMIALVSAFDNEHFHIETLTLMFAGFCIQIYLIALVRSLLRKFEVSGDEENVFENRLQQVVAGEIYETTVVSNEAA